MSQFKRDVVALHRTKNNHLYDMIQDQSHYGLHEELMGKESFANDNYVTQIMKVALLLYPSLIGYYFVYVQ